MKPKTSRGFGSILTLFVALGLAFAAFGCELIVQLDTSLAPVDGGIGDGTACTLCVDGMVITDEAGNQEIVPNVVDAGSASDAGDAAVQDAD